MIKVLWAAMCIGTICQTSQSASKRVFNWNISFIPGPFTGNQRPVDLLIRVLCWSLFSEREAGELTAGNAKIHTRTNKDNSKMGSLQVGVEAGVNLEGPL